MNMRWKPSVTVAGIIEDQGRYLLVEEHTPNGLMFNNPAGHLDPGESPIEACVREVLEETSLRVTALSLIGVYEFLRMNQVLIVYHAHAEGGRLQAGRASGERDGRTRAASLAGARRAHAGRHFRKGWSRLGV